MHTVHPDRAGNSASTRNCSSGDIRAHAAISASVRRQPTHRSFSSSEQTRMQGEAGYSRRAGAAALIGAVGIRTMFVSKSSQFK